LGQLCRTWEETNRDRNFDPNEEVFDFRIERKKGEAVAKFHRRQEDLIKEFVEDNLFFIQRGERQRIRLIRKHCQVIADLFFQREDPDTGEPVQAIIVWANRGGGKSLVAAITIYLCMVWRRLSFSDLAGSQEQAQEVYAYVTTFWNCIPIVKEKLLAGEPLQQKTVLKNAVSLKCIANSQNQARGKHPEGLVADEVCQKERFKDENVLQATNSVLTQDDFIILYISTFHLPIGLFAETWDHAESLDFKRYKWNVYDCMERCKRDIDCKKCRLTRRKIKKDESGNIVKRSFFGCNGKARKADGWMSFGQLLKIKKKAEIRGHNWRTEFECARPETKAKVYKTNKLRKTLVDRMVIPQECERSVGIDFGTSKQCAIVLTCMGYDRLLVPWSDFSVGRDLDYIANTLKSIRIRHGDFTVFADAEQSYGIMYLRKAGFVVESVAFNKYKKVGIANLERYINAEKIRILNVKPNRILYRQLVGYKKDELGKPVKKDDHGPDALFCAALRFDFMFHFGRAIKKEAAEADLKAKEKEDSEVEIF